jgi:L-fucose mutarotase
MLRYPLIHPPLLAVLSAAGHGSKILLADAHFPHSTGKLPSTPLIHLNLRPGLLTVDEILEVLLTAVVIESAEVMQMGGGAIPPVAQGWAAMMGDAVPIAGLERFAFYDACKGTDVAAIVATGDQRLFGNLLLTIGLAT